LSEYAVVLNWKPPWAKSWRYSGDDEFSLFLRKAFIKGAGYSDDALDRPIVGIVDTSSGFNPCHGNVARLVKNVERGVLLSGALPIPFPTISVHESFAHPTSMFLRNLMSLDTEEMIKAQPMDAVVLVCLLPSCLNIWKIDCPSCL
jgi:dihydroxy-acid dehydratase